ncbi:hypothetical protein CEXT_621111 [Caerostris extrusa]|uniref:Uncharacterized protein n=1 Tax=Caerostris extrusa TaxID=172846 RepID=A0AAV4XXZ1_CAEEX|nr:hypothetical protein CEXT_621111 [Caerostris extrusa]
MGLMDGERATQAKVPPFFTAEIEASVPFHRPHDSLSTERESPACRVSEDMGLMDGERAMQAKVPPFFTTEIEVSLPPSARWPLDRKGISVALSQTMFSFRYFKRNLLSRRFLWEV